MITTEIDNQGYHLVDSQTGERRTFADRGEWLHASMAEVLRRGEEIELGLARLQAIEEGVRT